MKGAYKSFKEDCPCVRDCPGRTITCKHDGTCDKYRIWREAADKQNADERRSEVAEKYAQEGARKRRARYQRKKALY